MKYIFFLLLFFGITAYSQGPGYSESLVKYDILTHTTDKAIPFNKPFTLLIEKSPFKDVTDIHVYQTEFYKGKRITTKKIFLSCDSIRRGSNLNDTLAIVDIKLTRFELKDNNLYMYFPALKPNETFDINIVSHLNADCFKLLLSANTYFADSRAAALRGAISQSQKLSGKAFGKFAEFDTCITDFLAEKSYTSIDSLGYEIFYNAKLDSIYSEIAASSTFKSTGSITQQQAMAFDKSVTTINKDFTTGYYLTEVASKGKFAEVMLGYIDVTKIFSSDDTDKANPFSPEKRLLYLKANLEYFDIVIKNISACLSKGIIDQSIAGTTIPLEPVKLQLLEIYNNIKSNNKKLEDFYKSIKSIIDEDERFRQGNYLLGNTVASDLKTAGGRILFLDAGFVNILAPDINDNFKYMPKLYFGISIYFKPIDKNTRLSRFSTDFDPKQEKGCVVDSSGKIVYGPDYEIVSTPSMWHRWSLNIGITLGSMTDKEFDNFYNSNSLLIGPSYRFARAFKVGGGIALLRRTSKNPVISEKVIIPAAYLSLSVDIDFIQSIKDVTSLVFK